ncbi:MAG: glycine cleavage system aminomethyltransferase GcvT, partial [candidate division Zixibacteria bacterium]|nr:glycine cleavage system aminomethyltransferase GcvT [candidate division Zixibacteria bacterium]
PPRRLICFELTEKGIPRKDYKLFRDNEEAGFVTSGIYSPTLEKGIGLGYLYGKPSKSGTAIQVEIRGKRVGAVVVKPPFYKHGSRK